MNDLCISEENFKEDVKWKVIEFLKITTGYDVMQDRNNIVVIDSKIQLCLAFELMIFHSILVKLISQTQIAAHCGTQRTPNTWEY